MTIKIKKAAKKSNNPTNSTKSSPAKKPQSPIWDLYRDGITQSLLGRFMECPERFRLYVVEGLREKQTFDDVIRFGTFFGEMFHAGLESHAKLASTQVLRENPSSREAHAKNQKHNDGNSSYYFKDEIKSISDFAKKIHEKYPGHKEEVQLQELLARRMFPSYYKHSQQTQLDFVRKTKMRIQYLFQEQVFRVPYKLPSGRTVNLRGKFDTVFDLISDPPTVPCSKKGISKQKSSISSREKAAGYPPANLWIQENKTKGKINDRQIPFCLPFDLQSMFYVVALQTLTQTPSENLDPQMRSLADLSGAKVCGVVYNIIRRPLSDKYSIRPKSEEDVASFTDRVVNSYSGSSEWYPVNKYPDKWFYRFQVRLTQKDINEFKRQILNPYLERLCDWWEHIQFCLKQTADPFKSQAQTLSTGTAPHYRKAWGQYSSIDAGWGGDFYDLLTTGSKLKLETVSTVFPEL